MQGALHRTQSRARVLGTAGGDGLNRTQSMARMNGAEADADDGPVEPVVVLVRIRPLPTGPGQQAMVQAAGNRLTVTTRDRVRGDEQRVECSFDAVFDELATQLDVYSYIKPSIDKVITGISTTVFAYGQVCTVAPAALALAENN